jgi:carbon-monoxide dehydrogenase large subunit
MDTYGSRSLTVGGHRLVGACDKVIAKAKRVAAHLMEASENDIEFTAGRLHVRGDPSRGPPSRRIGPRHLHRAQLPDGMEPSLDSEHTYDPENFSFPHGHRTCARPRSTPRPAGSPSARTWPSTTWARS